MPYLVGRLDVLDFPVQWVNGSTDRDSVHLLSYPFLFPPAILVSYFRAINHNAMTKAFQLAQVNTRMLTRLNYEDTSEKNGRGAIRLFERLRTSTSKYLILDIRRESILEDAMDQLWRREPGELMRPLKIRMGMTEGEEGVDLGGVQQEFFRLAIAEALDPKYGEYLPYKLMRHHFANSQHTGAFTTDGTTRMSWFQPLALEPLYMFEMVGLLTSLAIYNGLTLPFTFPKALYRRIAGLPCESISDIEDGWPELAKGLQTLLEWSDGDVSNVFMRPYTFSVDVFGTAFDTDMDLYGKRRSRKGSDEIDINARKSSPSHSGLDSGATIESSNVGLSPLSGSLSLGPCTAEDEAAERPLTTPTIPNERSVKTVDGISELTLSNLQLLSNFKHSNNRNSSSSRDTEKHQSSSSSDSTPMVTNANRHQFVRDYINHLTDISVRPQLTAFIKGFRRCLHPKSHHLFTEHSLKTLVEGHTVISTHALEAVTKYEPDDRIGYHRYHPTIQRFWDIVHEWGDPERGGDEGQEKVRRLLEFVTASDRLPVGGCERLQFVIQRNGVGDERLPSSMTCFGRLLLPQFSGREAMRRGLERAVQESKGFGLQ